jgi:hypothetical protein
MGASRVATLEEASSSMSPILRVGDQLTVAWDDALGVRRGAIVAYLEGHRVVAHRVLGRRGSVLRLKGDANRDADPPVDASRCCGEVVAVRRPDGRTLDLTSRRWRMAGAAIAALGVLPGSRSLRWVLSRAASHAAARWLS